jgi:hypothetical protein
MVALYETDAGNAEPRLLEVRPSADGSFRFSVVPQHQYRIEVTKEGFKTTAVPADFSENEMVVFIDHMPRFTAKDTTGAALLMAGQAPPANAAIKIPIYRVHLEIQPDFNAQAPRYGAARAFGKIIAEPLPEQGIVRILLGDFKDAKTANDVATALRVEGAFPQAFAVKGEN